MRKAKSREAKPSKAISLWAWAESLTPQQREQMLDGLLERERELFAGLSKVKWPVVLEDNDVEPK